MSRLDHNTGVFHRAEGRWTEARDPALPPPPTAGLRTIARLRGAFRENLPTLRLAVLKPRETVVQEVAPREAVAPTAVPAARRRRRLRLVAASYPRVMADGVPTQIGPETTNELASGDIELAHGEDDSIVAFELEVVPPSEATPSLGESCVSSVPVVVDVTHVTPAPVEATFSSGSHPTMHAVGVPSASASRPCAWACALAATLGALFVAVGAGGYAYGSARAGVMVDGAATGLVAVVPRTAVSAAQSGPPVSSAAIASPAIPVAASLPAVTAIAPSLPPPPPMPVSSAAAPTPTPAVSPPPKQRSVGRRTKSYARARREAVDEETTLEAEVAPAAPAVPSEAETWLSDAEREFAAGRFASALVYADRSRLITGDIRATRMAAISACRTGNAKAAESAFRMLPEAQRTGVRNRCREQGIELP